MERVEHVSTYYGSLQGMRKKFDQFGRKDFFRGSSCEEFDIWKSQTADLLKKLIGLDKMETCPLFPKILERSEIEGEVIREKILIQVEPDTYMPVYVLIPQNSQDIKKKCVLALPGHMGAGKYSIAGRSDIPAVADSIQKFHYDYGLALAKKGYVVFCPDARGFGERRDEALQSDEESDFLNSTCFHLAHMAEGMGETVIGMCTWDNMRLIDYIEERGEWDTANLGCVGFSGGGMQALWLAALDERIQRTIISGYMYGYKDSLMTLNGNCNCNYVPHLWEHVDMGDIASLIAPRKLAIQSCRQDKLNGPRGLVNVLEQMETIKKAYSLYQKEGMLIHDIREGEHCFHQEILNEIFAE